MSELILTTAEVEIVAAEGAKLPRVSILAYTGDVMSVPGFGPIVLDLAGMDHGSEIPLLADHANAIGSIVGQGSPSVRSGQLFVDGNCNLTTEAAKQIVDLAKAGHKFQASIGATPLESKRIAAGESVNANARTIKAASPFLLVTKSTLREVTICALGCDAGTSVSIAAKRKTTMPMNPKLAAFISEMGGDPTNISPEQLLKAQASFEGKPYVPAITAGNTLEAEGQRIESINAIEPDLAMARCNPQHETIVAALKEQAIQSGWTVNATELAILRASRPQARAIHGNHGGTGPQHLSASLMVKAGYSAAAEKCFGPNVLEQSRRLHGSSLPDLCRAALMIDGRQIPMERSEMIRAALSTGSMSVALGDSANKILFEAYRVAPSSWRSFASVRAAANFKTQHGLRPSFGGDLKELGTGGEVKHGTFAEEDFQWRVDTFAKQFSIDRRDIVNDDASVFSDIIPGLARAASRTLNTLVATTLLANAGSFFGSGNANYFEGSLTNLSAVNLGNAIRMLRQQKDSEGNLLDLQPAVLLVSPENEQIARALIMSSEVSRDVTLDQAPTGNTMKDVAALAVEPRLSDSTFTGNSSTAWYLFSDAVNAAVVVGFLDGMQSPVLESFGLDHDVNKLAYSFRVYHDFGCALADPRAAIKSKGAA